MSLNLDRIIDHHARAQALVFVVTGLAEQSFVAVAAARAEMSKCSNDDMLVNKDTAEYRELYELLTNLETTARSTRLHLASLTIATVQ